MVNFYRGAVQVLYVGHFTLHVGGRMEDDTALLSLDLKISWPERGPTNISGVSRSGLAGCTQLLVAREALKFHD